VRGQNDPMLGVDVLKNTLGVRGLIQKIFSKFEKGMCKIEDF